MDTSEQYIEMCEQAVEVQENWRAKSGDIFAYHSDNSFSDNFGLYVGDIPGRNLRSRHFIYDAGGIKKPLKEIPAGLIWLPRQDQLQEIMIDQNHEQRYCKLWYSFKKYVTDILVNSDDEDLKSFEQLWLFFLMKLKYDKIWDGKKWIQKNLE